MAIDAGRAVVTVVTNASAASLAATGKLIEKKLEESARKSGNVFARQFDISLGRGAVLFGTFNSLAAPLASTISSLGGGVVALGASFQQTSIAAASFGGVLGSLAQAITVSHLAFSGFFKAVNAATPEQFAKALEKIPPAARQAAIGLRAFKEELVTTVSAKVFEGLDEPFKELGAAVGPILRKQLTGTAGVVNQLLKDLANFGASESAVARFNTVLGTNTKIFDTLRAAVTPFLDGLLNLFVALGPSAQRLAVSIGELATRFQAWTSQAGFAERIDGIMQRAQSTAGLLLRTIGNLAKSLGAVFTAAAPAGNQFLTMLNNVFIRFNEFARSASGKAQIAAWAETGVQAMRELGHTLALLGPVFAKLADPAVFTSLLKVLESWAKTMAVLAPLLTTTAKALGLFAPVVGPALALSGVFFSITLQAKILKGVLASLGLGNLARGFLSSAAAASEATGVMGTVGGKMARFVDGIRLQTKALGGPGLLAAARTQFAAFGSFVVGLGPKIATAFRLVGTAIRTAFIANPVGVIVTGLILLGTALFVLYKKSETFRNAVNAVWSGIKAAAAATVDWFTSTALPALQAVWDGIMTGAAAIGGFLSTIWGGIVAAFGVVWNALLTVWNAVGMPIFTLIKGFITIWIKSIQVVWALIQVAFALVWFGLKTVWETVAVPIFDLIKAYIGLWISGLAIVWGLLTVAWNAIWSALVAVWEAVGVPLIELIQQGWQMFVDGLTVVWAALTAAWNVVWNAIVSVWNAVGAPLFTAIQTVWETLKSAAETVTSAIGGFFKNMWNGVVSAATSALNGLIGVMNHLIDGANLLIKATNAATGSKISPVGRITPLATGVRNFRGGVALVGEQGPELVKLPRGANVYTASQTRDMVDGNVGSTIINNNFYGPTTAAGRKQQNDWYMRFGPRYSTVGG